MGQPMEQAARETAQEVYSFETTRGVLLGQNLVL